MFSWFWVTYYIYSCKLFIILKEQFKNFTSEHCKLKNKNINWKCVQNQSKSNDLKVLKGKFVILAVELEENAIFQCRNEMVQIQTAILTILLKISKRFREKTHMTLKEKEEGKKIMCHKANTTNYRKCIEQLIGKW